MSETSAGDYDAVVIGGGPAGATAAAILAEHGRRVLVLEKRAFPRYSVGESLLPYCYPTLKRLGLVEKLNAKDFVKKYSVQFVSMDGQASSPFYFFKHLDHPSAQTWQVRRSEFDQMLIDEARERGAEVREGCLVKELIRDEDGAFQGVRARGPKGKLFEARAPMTIDASGREAFSLQFNNWRVPDARLNKIAIWTYYKGAQRDEGYDEGATTVAYVPEKGWFWYIPLCDDEVSVGIVHDKAYLYREGKDPEAIFKREIKNNRWIEDHLAAGEQTGPYRVTGDYSYRSRFSAANGLVLTGDAFAFLDPVFSSGVFLALKSGELAADAVHEALGAGDVSAERFADYSERFCSGIEAMRKLVYAFYDPNFNFGAMLKKYPEQRGALTDCLIGHVDRDLDALWEAMAEFAELPEPLRHGRPFAT